ncbi:MAG: thiamine pyrophosphate-dependent enzyme [Isosphaeraceae bacterium]
MVGPDADARGPDRYRSSRRRSPGTSTNFWPTTRSSRPTPGTITTWAARHLKIRRGMMFSCSGNLATMARLPCERRALAYPGRQVVAFVGDGGFSMLMCEFITAVKYGLPVKVVVIKNNTLGQIKWEQMVFLGNPEYGVELQPIDFVKFAEACGGVGFRCEKPEEVRPALEMAFASKKPAVVEAVVDPFEPPMPPQTSATQALHLAESLARGEPHRGKIATTIFRDKLTEFFGELLKHLIKNEVPRRRGHSRSDGLALRHAAAGFCGPERASRGLRNNRRQAIGTATRFRYNQVPVASGLIPPKYWNLRPVSLVRGKPVSDEPRATRPALKRGPALPRRPYVGACRPLLAEPRPPGGRSPLGPSSPKRPTVRLGGP